MTIWGKCSGTTHITTMQEKVWRIVEAQHVNSTRKLVDSREEQELLENLIDEVKPKLSEQIDSYYHYLLYSPFRYPPLEYGSRFGNPYEPSLWYGSMTTTAALAETAYYRLLFLRASHADFHVISSLFTGFQAQIHTTKSINLTESPFGQFEKEISSKSQYAIGQTLGQEMRAANVEAFLYKSARDKGNGINVGVFTLAAFAKKTPVAHSWKTWHCNATKQVIEFTQTNIIGTKHFKFAVEDFMVNDQLPLPA